MLQGFAQSMFGIKWNSWREAMIRTILSGAWVLSIVYCFNCSEYNNRFSILIFGIITALLSISIIYKGYIYAKKNR